MHFCEPVRAFGWLLHRTRMEAGESFATTVEADVPREQSANQNFYVRGAATVSCTSNRGVQDHVRRAGERSADRGPLVAGEYLTTALEPTEFWCVNWVRNRKQLPAFKTVVLQTGECDVLDGRVLVCRGKIEVHGRFIDGPASFRTEAPRETIALLPTYIMIFEKDR